MPSFGNRHLLRLRRVAPRLPASQQPLRALATAAAAVTHPSSTLPPFLLPSPHASSSKLTLDAFLERPDEALWSALSFAAEDELMSAMLNPSPHGPWIDPATAYLGLRGSSLFSHYLQLLLPRFRTLYANLRASGIHQVLVSDLVLRNPDARALREILLEEAETKSTGTPLRAGLVAQIYRTIATPLRRRTLPPLSRQATIVVARALRDQDSLDLLTEVYYQLAHTMEWEPEYAWAALQIPLHLANRGRAPSALKLLQYPLALGKLPAAALGRSSPNHPEAAALMVQSAVARTMFEWGMDVRATSAVDAILETMRSSEVSMPSLEVVLQACRIADLTKNPELVQWSEGVLLSLAGDFSFPPLPASSINAHLDALPNAEALGFYSKLSVKRYGAPETRHLLRIALTRPPRAVLRRLANDFSASGADDATVPDVLRVLAAANLSTFARGIYNQWREHSPHTLVDARTTIAVVRSLTRGNRLLRNTESAERVLTDYFTTSGRVSSKVEVALTMLHAHALITPEDSSKADQYIAVLIAELGEAGAEDALHDLVAREPALAHRLAQVAKAHGWDLGSSALAVAAACATRHWGALSALNQELYIEPGEEEYLASLQAARRGRVTAMLARFRTAVSAQPGIPILVPTSSAVLQRLGLKSAWAPALEVATLALSSAQKSHQDEVAQEVSRLLTGIAREAAEAQTMGEAAKARHAAVTTAWSVRGAELKKAIACLNATQRTLLGVLVDDVEEELARS
ncbi:uncharacterized protein LOC62_01G000336 [Vanrija pseudolonga]|uniref:Uncharacterized protein n=1 Tax=Vanrija pseudolonga TaxID=143232 RepID=A0AAF0XZ59_9TREE|nr:hypothetical protein LOC62_01G000336 [Vanrija pseudolonga]